MSLIHILDKQSDEIIGTLNSSKAELKDAIETVSIENKDTFDFTGLNKFDVLEKRNRLLVQNADGFFNEYIINLADQYRRHEKFIESDASFTDLKKAKVIEPTTLTGSTPQTAVDFALAGTEWQPGDIEWAEILRSIKIEEHTDSYSLLKKIAATFEMELRFRTVVDGSRILGRYVDLVKEIAAFEGKEITFGKDLVGIRRLENSRDIVTALIGVGPVREDGTQHTVLVENEEALQRWGRNGNHLIAVYEPETEDDEMTLERLTSLTETELNKRLDAVVSYECEAVSLEKVFGRAHEKIRTGQTVRIKDEGYTPPLYLEARIKETKVNPATKAIVGFAIGNFIEYKKEDLEKQLAALKNIMNDRLAKLVMASISSSGGDVFKNGIGSTTLTATLMLSGIEIDKDGSDYVYEWSSRNKNGQITAFSATGKEITVKAEDIDEKATYIVDVKRDRVDTFAQITISNVFDGTDGSDGAEGPQGPKGEQGDRGIQGLQGTDGKQGIPGEKGVDGKTSYTHIAYADTETGGGFSQSPTNKTYIGMYVDFIEQDSNVPSKYAWSLIKGADGTQGVSGKAGADGKTPYFHTAWANNQAGTVGFSTTDSVGKTHIGTYTDFVQADSDEPTKYKWSQIKGDKGDTGAKGADGIQGPKGADGTSQYVHIKYSANANGAGMTSIPQDNTQYVGLANTNSPTAPTTIASYKWAKFKGEEGNQGIPGAPGTNGETTYTWVKYADTASGGGMSDSPDGKLYIGLSFNKTTQSEGSDPAEYQWSLMPQNIEIGTTNLIISSQLSLNTNINATTGELQPQNRALATNYFIDVGSHKKITVSRKIGATNNNDGSTTFDFFRVAFYDVNSETLSVVTLNNSSNPPRTIEIPNDTKYIRVSTSREDLLTLMVNFGDLPIDWSRAPEDVEQEIKDAKEIAETAQSTANGKNSVFRQDAQPPGDKHKVGDLWFDTANGNRMYTWLGGSDGWKLAALDFQALSIGNLSAISADLGNITAGSIKGTTMDLANGKFVVDSNGNVTFKGLLDGAYGRFGAVEVGGSVGSHLVVRNASNQEIFRVDRDGIVDSHGRQILGREGIVSYLSFSGDRYFVAINPGGYSMNAHIEFYIPPNFKIVDVKIHATSIPLYDTYDDSGPYHARIMWLHKLTSYRRQWSYDYEGAFQPSAGFARRLSVPGWTGNWDPMVLGNTSWAHEREADITSEVTTGNNLFYVQSLSDYTSEQNNRGWVKLDVIVRGYDNG